jgi:HPt (histidine-containing phosphotransfer) domain-containing protein
MTDPATSLEGALREIWEQSREEVRAQVAVIEGALSAAIADELDAEERRGACEAAHTVAGSVGTLGFDEAAVLASELQQAFAAPASTPLDPDRLVRCMLELRSELFAPVKL